MSVLYVLIYLERLGLRCVYNIEYAVDALCYILVRVNVWFAHAADQRQISPAKNYLTHNAFSITLNKKEIAI